MKKLVTQIALVIVACLFANNMNAQFYYKWAGNLTAIENISLPNGTMAVDNDGNLYITGSLSNSVDFNLYTGINTLTSAGSTDIFIAKYDSLGNYVWAKNMGSTGNDAAYSVTIDNNSNIYITGSFQGTVDFDPNAGTTDLTTLASSTNMFIAKYDSSGNLIWAHSSEASVSGTTTYGGTIKFDYSKNITITGSYSGSIDFDPSAGSAILTTSGSFIAKYDTTGAYKWVTRLNINPYNAIATDSLSNVYVTGNFNNTTDFDPGAGTSNLTPVGSKDIFVAKYDSTGAYSWAFRLGGTYTFDNDNASSITVDAVGNVYVSGVFNGGGNQVDFDPGAGTANLSSGFFSSDRAVYLAKYTSSGAYSWAFTTCKDGIFAGGGGIISLDKKGDVYFTGLHGGDGDFDPGASVVVFPSNGGYDAFMVKYSAAGAYVGGFSMGGTYNEKGYTLFPDSKGNIYVTGNFASIMDFDPTTNTILLNGIGGNGSLYIARYGGCSPALITNHPSDAEVCPTAGTTFLVNATGDGLSYQWQYNNGSGFTNITNNSVYSGATSATLTLSNITTNMSGTQYQCLITGSCTESTTSNLATLTVKVAPSINVQPINAIICSGEDTLMFVNATGVDLSYQWQYYTGTYYYNLIPSTNYSGINDDTLHILGSYNNLTYRCVISGECGLSVNSNPATLTVNQLPLAYTGPSRAICNGDAIEIGTSATSGNTYLWTPATALSSAMAANPTANPTSTTTYYLTETTIATGCTNSNEITITVNPLPTVTAISNPDTAVCYGTSVTLTGDGANTYEWSGGVINGIGFIPSDTTTYMVIGTDNNNCTNTATITVNVNPLPLVTANASQTDVCEGTSVTLTGGGAASYVWTGEVLDGINFTPLSTASYSVIGTDVNGCKNSAEILISINPFPMVSAIVSPSNSVCEGTSVTLIGEGATTYLWSGGVTNGVSFVPLSTSTYTVIGTNEIGCSDTTSVDIIVNIAPYANIGDDNMSVCNGDILTFSLTEETGVESYSITNGLQTSNNNPLTFTFNSTQVIVQSNVIGTNGCTSQDVIHLVDNSIFNLFQLLPTMNDPSFTFNAAELPATVDSWMWDFGDGDTQTGGMTAQHTFTANGTYNVCLIGMNECDTVSTCWSIPVTQVAIEEFKLNNSISLFPNPTKGAFTIQNDSPDDIEIVIDNVLGDKIETFSISKNVSKVLNAELSPGIYLVKITNFSGVSVTRKIVIEK